jgi:hypothetical protein
MAGFKFSIRTIFAATLVISIGLTIAITLMPRDAKKEATRISNNAPRIALDRIYGQYVCGSRGSVYRCSLRTDGSYLVDDLGCLGANGSVKGTWKQNGNVLELNPIAGSGNVYTNIQWLLATMENGCVVLTPSDSMERYLEHGYSPFWSLTKEGEAATIRALTK